MVEKIAKKMIKINLKNALSFKIPAMSATPAGSTSSMYCRDGHLSLGIMSMRGLAAFAPRNTNPNPFLPLCSTHCRGKPATNPFCQMW